MAAYRADERSRRWDYDIEAARRLNPSGGEYVRRGECDHDTTSMTNGQFLCCLTTVWFFCLLFTVLVLVCFCISEGRDLPSYERRCPLW